ncbi:hypothetical protein HID58_094964 [Brassica napus]|uniref:Potassium transporter n=1 Tax=Brassica napus TaxID=3708 RepID=A0ABQ7X5B7_BRANA|nr:hypothetical protein HID58_094964 [Brassica napus]
MEETVESSVTEGESTIEKRDREAMREFEEGLDQPMKEANMLKNMNKEKTIIPKSRIVYGDLGTSPLYVFYNTFPDGINDSEDYVFIVCKANDNGQGGTLAIFSLLCRHANVNLIPNQQRSDENLTTYSRTLVAEGSFAAKTKKWLESDGILTPAISDIVVFVSIVILIGLFSMQHYGTDKVGWLFAPIVLIWFLFIGATGIYNICKHDTRKTRTRWLDFSRWHSSQHNRHRGTIRRHFLFPFTSDTASFYTFCIPLSTSSILRTSCVSCEPQGTLQRRLLCIYPGKRIWPMLIVATGAAIVGSQATISGTYSLIKQAVSHGCFPRVKIVHTSKKFLSQIYCPDINWILMIGCIAVTARTAVMVVMIVTTLLMVLTMLLVWRWHWILVLIFAVLSLVVELSYFSAVLLKVNEGGWVPLIIAAFSLLVMFVWNYVTVKKYEFEVYSKVSMSWILGLGPSLGLVRVPGIGLVHTELASGVPHIFSHFITNLPAIHSVVVFVCVKNLPVYTVSEEERFMVKRIGPKTFRMFRCVARYGYKDLHRKDDNFENQLFDNLFSLFIQTETMMESYSL